MLKNINFIIICMFSCCSYASQKLEHGPFHIKSTNTSIEFVRKKDESIDFVSDTNNKIDVVDTYQVGDGVPKIDTVFFSVVKDINNIVVLVSWDEENISAVHYKIYLYTYSESGRINRNDGVMVDRNFEGYDGYSGNGMVFNYKDAADIKKYLSQLK
ncbi:hypothetical protein [Yokenella regensburgei]|uniref:hypothetical protein n=1 Tax=Yokenella regensburgei TaxID=158877 RepID=UPI0020776E31|nr:hypothetical protein [Yokenella regensburgei]